MTVSNWEKTMKEWDDSVPDGIKYLSAEKQVLMRRVRELESENARLKDAQRWIPVSERLPEESDWTLIRYKGYRVPYTLYYDIDRGWACGETPDYWMSLPEMQEVNNE